jgi:Arc/MetJ-type ribon-helix-helix transcriptional regulator
MLCYGNESEVVRELIRERQVREQEASREFFVADKKPNGRPQSKVRYQCDYYKYI